MILKDAIKHLEEELNNKQDWSCVACKEDHEQLLCWLKELQAIKDVNSNEALECLERKCASGLDGNNIEILNGGEII